MLIPVSTLVEQRLDDAATAPNHPRARGVVVRLALVLFTAVVIFTLPQFADLLEVVGATCCSMVAFVLPALIHLRVFRTELGLGARALDVAVMVVGCGAFVLGLTDLIMKLTGV